MKIETIQSQIDRDKIREGLSKMDWNVFLTLLFHRHLPIEEGNKLIHKWDGVVNHEFFGGRYSLSKNKMKRMVFWGCNGFDSGNHLHTHLLVKVPRGWKTSRKNGIGFEKVIRDCFSRVCKGYRLTRNEKKRFDGEVFFTKDDRGSFDIEDKGNSVSYPLRYRHLSFDEYGLDTSSIVESHNSYESIGM